MLHTAHLAAIGCQVSLVQTVTPPPFSQRLCTWCPRHFCGNWGSSFAGEGFDSSEKCHQNANNISWNHIESQQIGKDFQSKQIPITRWLLYKFLKGTAQGAAELTCQNIVPETFNFSWLSGDLEVICAVLVSWSEMTGLFPSEYDVLTASSKVLDSRRCQQTKFSGQFLAGTTYAWGNMVKEEACCL